MKKISGIYIIRSICKPKRCYIGSSMDIFGRWERHKNEIGRNIHHSKKLQNHANKYGLNDLLFSILIECDKNELIVSEQFFIDAYNPYFNNSPTAGSPMGCKHSEETKRKLSEIARKRQPISEETRKKLSLAGIGRIKSDEERRKRRESLKGKMPSWTGKKHSEETKAKIRAKAIGRKHSDKTRQKVGMASSLRNRGENNPNYGRKWSEEIKKKMSESHKNISEETRRKMSDAMKKRIYTPEYRLHLSQGHTGKKHSDETKIKIREGLLKNWKERRKIA